MCLASPVLQRWHSVLLNVEFDFRPSALDLISNHVRDGSTTKAAHQGWERFEVFITLSQSVSSFSPMLMSLVASCVQISSAERKLSLWRGLRAENVMTSRLSNSE